MSRPLDLLEEDGKLSRTGVMFMVWMTFFMVLIGYVTFKTDKLADIPEPYVYVTLVLCGTYTARRFLSDKYGKNEEPVVPPVTPPVTPPVVPVTPPATTTTDPNSVTIP